jgi:hypothetical protein
MGSFAVLIQIVCLLADGFVSVEQQEIYKNKGAHLTNFHRFYFFLIIRILYTFQRSLCKRNQL